MRHGGERTWLSAGESSSALREAPRRDTGATAYSVAAWVDLAATPMWSRIFDFGTGTGANMFVTPLSGAGTLRYAITIGGADGEQHIEAPPLATGAWKHVGRHP